MYRIQHNHSNKFFCARKHILMNSRTFYSLLFSAPPAAGALLYIYLRTSPASAAEWQLDAPDRHHKSFSQSIVNPRNFKTAQDSLTLRIPERRLPPTITDEEILARFSKGFFGGWVFWPEKMIFLISGWRVTRFTSMCRDYFQL
jgi:hypothetical protein